MFPVYDAIPFATVTGTVVVPSASGEVLPAAVTLQTTMSSLVAEYVRLLTFTGCDIAIGQE
jgi:hypothetical protein